ncbi:MAG: C39 family peptidase [Phycisphaerae bacterium]|nr:C39 family peptidase [Phycisphaerae bacterium]
MSPTNNLRGKSSDRHGLLLDDTDAILKQGQLERPLKHGSSDHGPSNTWSAVYTSRAIETAFPFNQIVPSWNVDLPAGTGFCVELRMGRKSQGSTPEFWTPFYYFGTWGIAKSPEQRVIRDDHGVVNIDTFHSTQSYDRIQYRFILETSNQEHSKSEQWPTIRRVGLAYSNTLDNDHESHELQKSSGDELPESQKIAINDSLSDSAWCRRLLVPWRSQAAEDEAIRHSVCSPTAVAMVLQYDGIDLSTARVAQACYDPEYKIYGNWIRNVQAAYEFGDAGYIQRFNDWDAVKRVIAAGRPIVASIKVARDQLRHAPYRASPQGHLIVITGFDRAGNVFVNDPAGRTAQSAMVTYFKEDLENVWFGSGGVGYVLIGPITKK